MPMNECADRWWEERCYLLHPSGGIGYLQTRYSRPGRGEGVFALRGSDEESVRRGTVMQHMHVACLTIR